MRHLSLLILEKPFCCWLCLAHHGVSCHGHFSPDRNYLCHPLYSQYDPQSLKWSMCYCNLSWQVIACGSWERLFFVNHIIVVHPLLVCVVRECLWFSAWPLNSLTENWQQDLWSGWLARRCCDLICWFYWEEAVIFHAHPKYCVSPQGLGGIRPWKKNSCLGYSQEMLSSAQPLKRQLIPSHYH